MGFSVFGYLRIVYSFSVLNSDAERHSLSSFPGLNGILLGPWNSFGMIAYKFQGVGIESLRGLFFGLCGVLVIPGAMLWNVSIC